MNQTKRMVRCAIYTRKSTEDDLADGTSQALEWIKRRCSALLYLERQIPDTPQLPRPMHPKRRVSAWT